MTVTPEELQQRIDAFVADTARVAKIVNGGATETVAQSAGGVIPTFAKVFADFGISFPAGFYPTTAAGVAGVVDGGYFLVPGPDANTYAILYKRAGSAANEISRYASKAATDYVRIAATPLYVPTVTQNNASATILTFNLPAGAPALADGSILEFYMPAVNLGPIKIVTAQLGTQDLKGQDGGPTVAGQIAAGTRLRIKEIAGGGVFGIDTSLTTSIEMAALRSQATGLALALKTIAKLPFVLPINGNVNALSLEAAPVVDGSIVTGITTATTTAGSTLTAGGVTAVISNGGAAIGAGDITSAKIATFQYTSGGGVWVLTKLEEYEIPKSLGLSPDRASRDTPYGIVTFNASKQRTITQIVRAVTVPGSSNAASGYMSAALLPAKIAADALNEQIAGDGISYVDDTVAYQGAPVSTLQDQLNTSAHYNAKRTAFIAPHYWANDIRTIFYHDNGGPIQAIDGYKKRIIANRRLGFETIVVLGYDADPRASATAYDPNWYADTRSYPDGGSARGMVWPATLASPVDPETQMTPPKSKMLFDAPIDRTGNGIKRQGYARLQHFNRLLSLMAEELGCFVWDYNSSVVRRILETMPDFDAGLETYWATGNPLHPKDALHELAVKPVIQQWARAVARGDFSRRVFTGY